MFGAIYSRHFQSGLHIPAMCHLCGTGGTNFKVTVSQQLIVGMFRKMLARVILTCLIQNCIQAFLIHNTFW